MKEAEYISLCGFNFHRIAAEHFVFKLFLFNTPHKLMYYYSKTHTM